MLNMSYCQHVEKKNNTLNIGKEWEKYEAKYIGNNRIKIIILITKCSQICIKIIDGVITSNRTN